MGKAEGKRLHQGLVLRPCVPEIGEVIKIDIPI
jgi:hypothetical protein